MAAHTGNGQRQFSFERVCLRSQYQPEFEYTRNVLHLVV